MNNLLSILIIAIPSTALISAIYNIVLQYKTEKKVAKILIKDSVFLGQLKKDGITRISDENLTKFNDEVIKVIGKLEEKEENNVLECLSQPPIDKKRYLNKILKQTYSTAS